MLIAQVTDTHIKANGRLAYDRVDTADKLARCIAHLNRLPQRPDVTLLTGDLVDAGRPGEYAVLRRLIAPLAMPVYVIPGNHDARGAFREAFTDHAYLPSGGEFLHYVIEQHPLRLIGLDSTVPGKAHGELCAERLAWLDARLAEAPRRPTLVFTHHPPFLTGLHNMDLQNCRNGDALGAVIERHPQVVRLLRLHPRASDLPPAPLAAGHGPDHAPDLHRRLRRPPPLLRSLRQADRLRFRPSRNQLAPPTGRQRRRPSSTTASIRPALWMGSRQIDAFAKLLGV
jgi:hypothetical protein